MVSEEAQTEWAEVAIKFHQSDGSTWTFYVPHLEAILGRSLGEIHVEPIYETEDGIDRYRSTLEALFLTITLNGRAEPDAEGNRYYHLKGDDDGK